MACVVGLCFFGTCEGIRVELSQVEFLELSQADHPEHIGDELFSSIKNESYGIEDDQTMAVQVWFKFQWTRDLTSIGTRRQVGRPKKRWEDDLNEFMKTEEGQDRAKFDLMNNNSWMDEIKDFKNGKKTNKSSQRSGRDFLDRKARLLF